MQATRIFHQRAFAQLAKNTAASKNGLLARASTSASVAAPAISSSSRSLSTVTTNENEALQLLNKQRAVRPSSPHFTIYEPQLSWLSSIANRVTGTGLSGGLYAFAIAYVGLPAMGIHFDAASVVSFVSAWPGWLKVSAKMLVGLPFWYHNFNGLRHLSWDMGYLLSLRSSWIAGYVVIGATVVSTLATALLL
ncbi:MAG: cytochrome b subunit of succinate dehydrogenase, Sdh3p [Cyphobasidiales sp. Tagirdzhanova-0007]|nr:MAG: cytochrome b subunit of succinate dehydrogenase, Sdh3p [Cyphobasidiales sp. Tagirdzhanova-0007]